MGLPAGAGGAARRRSRIVATGTGIAGQRTIVSTDLAISDIIGAEAAILISGQVVGHPAAVAFIG